MAHNTLPTMVMSSLFDRVPPEDELNDAVAGIVATMGKMPRAALEGAKEYLKTAYSMDVTGAVDFARNLHATINSSSELKG